MGIITFVGCVFSGICGLLCILCYCVSDADPASVPANDAKKEYEKSTAMKDIRV
jgi:hypothetical protein